MAQMWASRDRIERLYEQDLKAASKAGDWARHRELSEERHFEITCVDDEIGELETRFLTREAHRLLIGQPRFDDSNARESRMSGKWILNSDVLAELRARIRKERAAKTSHLLAWLGALTGLVGALIGLVAVLQNAG